MGKIIERVRARERYAAAHRMLEASAEAWAWMADFRLSAETEFLERERQARHQRTAAELAAQEARLTAACMGAAVDQGLGEAYQIAPMPDPRPRGAIRRWLDALGGGRLG